MSATPATCSPQCPTAKRTASSPARRWAKSDYGVPGQYSHEPARAAYVETLRTVFREARRVLTDDGTCWLNLGDSYPVGGAAPTGLHGYLGRGLAGRHAPGLGAKNLLGLPWRVALAIQDDGWTLRNAIVSLTYHPDTSKVDLKAQPLTAMYVKGCPRGDLNPHALLGH
jgi:hypothetical protein